MKNLGRKMKNMYDAPSSPQKMENETIYPEFDLPLELVKDAKAEVGDMVDIHLKAKVVGMQDTKWSKRADFEAHEGEVKKVGGEKKKTVMEGA